jgi:glycosyltransferase involved in cell wall biosynthesis
LICFGPDAAPDAAFLRAELCWTNASLISLCSFAEFCMPLEKLKGTAAQRKSDGLVRPLVSIIVPSFNQGRFLREALKSILAQRYPKLELIVIDGGSTDNSISVIQECGPEITYWVSEVDRGQSHAVNKGLAAAHGEIVGWLNSDDLYLGDCIRSAVEYFTNRPDIDVVFGDYYYIDEDGNLLRSRREPPLRGATYIWTGKCRHANCAGFFRRRILQKVQGLDESLHYAMDYDWYVRMSLAGACFGQVRSFWGGYRLHQQSKTFTNSDKMTREGRTLALRYQRMSHRSILRFVLRPALAAHRIVQKVLLCEYFKYPAFSLKRGRTKR